MESQAMEQTMTFQVIVTTWVLFKDFDVIELAGEDN